MDQINEPDWVKSTRKNEGGNPAWTKGCPSPNPKGRPKGIIDKRQRLQQALADQASEVTRVVIDAALGGDMQAASLVLSRVAPTLKAQAERVEFAFDSTAPVAQQVEQVLQAIADGKVAPDVGRHIIDAIGSLSAVRAVDDMDQRLQALEGKQ
ncbi:DUF5681 domain-containing protein [Cupriavidus plantarum]|uniref:DUF5681 domain-containing protein n=1 Tax=Cupriavidus plantarum TaxID=942865 RepID=UPI000EADED0A|nr:DUF5681 domain-containing protein [Cupriavidus plantarum]RLK44535.1 hypothetical protein C7417_0516 [Cupriavidus plantarum]